MKIVQPTSDQLETAAKHIRAGRLVIVPTETVYGVAVDATNPDAAKKLFEAKARPAENPLIVHISSLTMLRDIARAWNPSAETLAERFWPGPLTLVVYKSPNVPDIITGGLKTVAIRMPEHPIALELINLAGVPLAMPSANRFMELSPTRIEHISPELESHVELILDGGPCQVGVESTVVDVSEEPARILRPGGVSRADIEAALKMPLSQLPPSERRSPGMYARHYAPKARVRLVAKLGSKDVGLTFDSPTSTQIKMPKDPRAYAASLYDALHKLDKATPTEILVQTPPDAPEWEAVLDRLKKASG